jgi:hypothetical protein
MENIFGPLPALIQTTISCPMNVYRLVYLCLESLVGMNIPPELVLIKPMQLLVSILMIDVFSGLTTTPLLV